jgi:Uma2 family endonuclease
VFMATKCARWTREDLERFPSDGNRYEVLDGELLVTPQASLDHQVVAARLANALYAYCNAHGVGLAVGPAAVRWGKNELQPDIEVIPDYRFGAGQTWETAPRPILVVEVLSPFSVSRGRDLDAKRKAYLRLGIAEYWVVDHERRRVHVWSARRRERIVTDVLRWNPNPSVTPFELPCDRPFGPTGN